MSYVFQENYLNLKEKKPIGNLGGLIVVVKVIGFH